MEREHECKTGGTAGNGGLVPQEERTLARIPAKRIDMQASGQKRPNIIIPDECEG